MTSVHGDTRRETPFLEVFTNHTMLTPPQRAVHLVMSKISVGRDPKKNKKQLHLSTVKFQLSPQWSNLNWLFSKSSNSQGHLFRAWRHLHSSPISCLKGFSQDKWWLSYPLRASVTASNDFATVLRDSISSKPYQTEW